MRRTRVGLVVLLDLLLPATTLATDYVIETEAGPSWRAIGPPDTLSFENDNPGWNSDPNYDDSDSAGWSASDFIRVYHEGSGEDMIWASNRNTVAYFRHVFTLDGAVTSAVMDGVIDDDGQIYINGTLVYEDINGGWTDFSGIDIAPFLTSGTNLIAAKAWDVMLLEGFGVHIDINTIPEPTTLWLDIKPGSCPNLLNRKSRGKLRAAILGTADFDVATVDLATVELSRADGIGGTVAPLEGPPGPRSAIKDVGTPFDAVACGCHRLRGDGIADLSMRFNTHEVADVLELHDLAPGTSVELIVCGNLLDGTPFTASDCVLLVR